MNTTEKRMLELLRDLRDNHGVDAIKAEFEAEGSRMDELVKLNEIVFRADMDLFIKIGGCEAVRDLDQCRLLGATGIMAPMIETPFAMSKFVGAANKVYKKDEQKDINFIINAETRTCVENLDEILDAHGGILNYVVVGRVDLSGSYGLGRSEINGEFVYKITREICERSKAKGFKAGMGGGISMDALPFVERMSDVIDRFETRKVVFSKEAINKDLRKGLTKAMEFEMLYLKNKCDFYDRMAFEDRDRLTMLEGRLAATQKDLLM